VAFRLLGAATGQELLGARVVSSFLMFATVSGILMALFLNNSGGAWDNAKKYVETGAFGGKGSEAHKAAITGDTCACPCPLEREREREREELRCGGWVAPQRTGRLVLGTPSSAC
jgi:hypothetical protein